MRNQAILLGLLLSLPLSARLIPFQLNAEVLDSGQNIISIELKTQDPKLKQIKLHPTDFKVTASGTLPFSVGDNPVFGTFNQIERKITSVKVNAKGNVVLALEHGNTIEGANTLAYVAGEINRNIPLQLNYHIDQQTSLPTLPANSSYQQQTIVDPAIAKFQPKHTAYGMPYQWFTPPEVQTPRPLIIWLHGNGEGGYAQYQNNLSPLLANRGGAAFVSPETQAIFGGAYVMVPQVPDTWYHNYTKDYLTQLHTLINEAVAENRIDPNRIYLFGASAGGYMALRMLIEYPDMFAGVSLSAPALDRAVEAGGVPTTLQELQRIKGKPLWIVHAVNDPTIAYTQTSKRIFMELSDSGAILSAYPEVKIGQTQYNGHWSWIYTLRNLPMNAKGEHLFEWMAKQYK